MLLHKRLHDYRLILASRSPRRRQLLADCDLPFIVASDYPCDEVYPEEMISTEVPAFLSRLKSDAYPETLAPNDILITADTVVIAEDRILGKPHDRRDAISMLNRISGKKHQVITGVTLRNPHSTVTFAACSDVYFRALTDEEIDYYVDTYRPFDKAGAYGIQEWIGCAGVERIDGSFYNVMGLPVQQLYIRLGHMLDELEAAK